QWVLKAAEQGDADAQFHLGVMYDSDKSAVEDNVYAYMWVSVARSSGYAEIPEAEDIIAEKMTSENIAKAQSLARECIAKNFKGC
ncbi:MAG: sel1 repeat family protein, partial [Halocynthiibacter sp.]